MRTKRSSTKDDFSSSGDTKSTSILSSCSLKQRAADMIANGVDLSTFGEPKPDANTLSEIREGAMRLATELDDYLSKHDTSNNYISPFRLLKGADGTVNTNLSDDAIADLQLSTARKLREVSKNKTRFRVKTGFLELTSFLCPLYFPFSCFQETESCCSLRRNASGFLCC